MKGPGEEGIACAYGKAHEGNLAGLPASLNYFFVVDPARGRASGRVAAVHFAAVVLPLRNKLAIA
jgi:hypothetical protein